MEAQMTPQARLAEIQALIPALIAIRPLLAERREMAIKKLIATESEEARGRIKTLDELLELPNGLQQEAANLQRTTADAAR